MDDFPRSKVAVRELSRTSQTSTAPPHHAAPSPTLSKTSTVSSRNSGEAPRSPPTTTTHTRNTAANHVSLPLPSDFKPTTAFDPDAPAPYREEDFKGKSNDEVRQMRKRDYAVEISRLMGRQLVRGMNGKGGNK